MPDDFEPDWRRLSPDAPRRNSPFRPDFPPSGPPPRRDRGPGAGPRSPRPRPPLPPSPEPGVLPLDGDAGSGWWADQFTGPTVSGRSYFSAGVWGSPDSTAEIFARFFSGAGGWGWWRPERGRRRRSTRGKTLLEKKIFAPPAAVPVIAGIIARILARALMRELLKPKPQKPPPPEAPVMPPPPVFTPNPAPQTPGQERETRYDPPERTRTEYGDILETLPTVIVTPGTRRSPRTAPGRQPAVPGLPQTFPAPVIVPTRFPVPSPTRIPLPAPNRAPTRTSPRTSPGTRTRPGTFPATWPASLPGTLPSNLPFLPLFLPGLFPRSSPGTRARPRGAVSQPARPGLTPSNSPGVASDPLGFAQLKGGSRTTNKECCACRAPRKKKRKKRECVRSVIRDTVTGLFTRK